MRSIHNELPEAWREALGDEGAAQISSLPPVCPSFFRLKPSRLHPGFSVCSRACGNRRCVTRHSSTGSPALGSGRGRGDRHLRQAQGPGSLQRTPLTGGPSPSTCGGPRTAGAETFLVRFAPGHGFPRTRHPARKSSGPRGELHRHARCDRPTGDLHEMEPGASMVLGRQDASPAWRRHPIGREFTGPLMRVIAALFDRKSGILLPRKAYRASTFPMLAKPSIIRVVAPIAANFSTCRTLAHEIRCTKQDRASLDGP